MFRDEQEHGIRERGLGGVEGRGVIGRGVGGDATGRRSGGRSGVEVVNKGGGSLEENGGGNLGESAGGVHSLHGEREGSSGGTEKYSQEEDSYEDSGHAFFCESN